MTCAWGCPKQRCWRPLDPRPDRQTGNHDAVCHELKQRLVATAPDLELAQVLGSVRGTRSTRSNRDRAPEPRNEPAQTGPGWSDLKRCPRRCTRTSTFTARSESRMRLLGSNPGA